MWGRSKLKSILLISIRVVMKILFYSVLLLLCFAGKAQTGIGFFTTGELRYPHRVDINSNSNPVYINENKNVSLINKIFQSNYTAYNFTTTGFITGEYTQTNGYGGCSHKGIDYRATTGTAIYAVMNGIVTADGTNQYGTIAIYNAAENITVLYLHCSSSNVINGANVTKGAKIGESGNTSPDNIAAHLHFELRQGNTNGSAAGQCASINSSNTYDPRILDDIFTPTVTLTSPINNAQQHSENINFSWNALPNASSYYIQISTTSTFNSTVINANVGNVSSKAYSLQPNTEYFWRVRSNLSTDFSPNDEVRRLLTLPAPPILISPAFGASNIASPVLFDWEDVQNANAYRIQVSDNAGLLYEQYNGPYLLDYPATGSTLTQSNFSWSGALPNKTYYWRVRVNTNKGTSLYKARSFSTGQTIATVNYAQMYYWFDNGPVSNMSINNDADIFLPTSQLSTGNHTAYFYFTDNTGLRSSITQSSFYKGNSGSAEQQMEYWFDQAFANRQSMVVSSLNNIDLTLPIDALDLGPHNISYRFKTGADNWSSIATSTFTKTSIVSGSTKMEYWFNNNFDNRTATTISNLNNVDVNINTNDAPLGTNILYSRFQKTNGLWSGITATTFLKTETGNNGWQYQYWVDSTMGFATTLSITNPANIDLNADVNNADTGWHIIHSRFRKNNGLWSSVTADSFYKATATAQCTITNSPSGEDSIATHFLCKYDIINNPQDGIFNQNKILRADLAKITYRGLVGTTEPVTLATYLPSLFGDLQISNANNSYYFNAAKFLSYIDYGDGIAPFNPSRLNFHANDTIVRGYTLKVLMEAWNIKPDESLPNPYADVLPGTEVYGYIVKAAQMGLIKQGAGFENFRPFEASKRVEAFLMLYRILQICSKPEITDADFHIPYNRNEIVGNNPSLGEGNFSSYGETPFTIKGVPSLSFSFNYNAASTEIPDEGVIGRNESGNMNYNQQTLGVGWNHNYNNYILVDTGVTSSTTDDRYLIMWSSGNVQVYNPNTNIYVTQAVYDELTKDNINPTEIFIKTKSQVTYRFQKLPGVNAPILVLVSVKDRHNNTVNLTYENGYSAVTGINIKRLKEVDDSHNRKIVFTYFPNTNLIDSVSANAGSLHKAVHFEYVAKRLVKYTNPKNDFTIYNYSSLPGQQYLITKIIMPKGNTITNKYSNGNKLTSTDVNGSQQTLIQTTATHTASSNYTDIKIKNISNGIMQEQTMRNNQYNMPVSASGPNYNTGMEYTDAVNPLLPTKIKDSLTNVEVIPVYSSNGNLLSITKTAPGINITETMQYNSFNDITQKTDGRNNTTYFTYNPTGQLTQIDAPNGVVTKIAPNANGTVDSITNPSLIGTKFYYDAFGNLTQTKLPLGIISKAENDAYGRLLKSINPNNIGTNYLYDANDNMLQESFDTSGLNIITQYRFDKNNNLIEVENAKGNITYLTYNDNDQLIKEQFGNAIKQYQYSDDGRLKKFINPNGVNFTNQFNDKDLLVNDGYASYNYYADNSLQSITRNGKAITYTYDALKRITAVNYNDFANNTVGYEYDNNNNITKITYPNGVAVKYDYDANNRLTVVKDNNNTPWAIYNYLADGRLNTQTNANGTLVKYFYDAAGRMDSMVTVKADGSIIAAYGFELDVLGNHKKEIFNQPFMQTPPAFADSIAYTYSNTNRLLTKNTDSYSYDNNGNLTAILKNTGNINYSYDPKNNLLQYSQGNNSITYEYDGLGQRRRRNNTRYVLDNAYNVLIETDANGNAQYYYIHGLGMIARVKISTGQPYYYHHDFRGSTVAITNSSQTITHQYQYGSFGETQQVQEEDFNSYRYVGKYGVGYESKDLTFMRARYYQPSVGRFNSEYPVWATNLYPYGNNNPLLFIDPSGKISIGTILDKSAWIVDFFGQLRDLVGSKILIWLIKKLPIGQNDKDFLIQFVKIGLDPSASDTDLWYLHGLYKKTTLHTNPKELGRILSELSIEIFGGKCTPEGSGSNMHCK